MRCPKVSHPMVQPTQQHTGVHMLTSYLENHPTYPTYANLLSPGWIAGRQVVHQPCSLFLMDLADHVSSCRTTPTHNTPLSGITSPTSSFFWLSTRYCVVHSNFTHARPVPNLPHRTAMPPQPLQTRVSLSASSSTSTLLSFS